MPVAVSAAVKPAWRGHPVWSRRGPTRGDGCAPGGIRTPNLLIRRRTIDVQEIIWQCAESLGRARLIQCRPSPSTELLARR
jgi:hypothetical protein